MLEIRSGISFLFKKRRDCSDKEFRVAGYKDKNPWELLVECEFDRLTDGFLVDGDDLVVVEVVEMASVSKSHELEHGDP